MKRYFAGIELSDAVKTVCADVAERLRATGFAAAYQSPEKLHLTLAFLGNIDETRCLEVERALIEAASLVAPFDFALDRIGAFPHERKPRVIFAGARDQGRDFQKAAEAVRAAYARIGFAFTEDAVAHVTIARVKSDDAARRPPPQISLTPIRIDVREFALFESIFDPPAQTTRYEIRARAPLAA